MFFFLKVPLFANTELGFTKLLALSIKPVMFLSGEYIIRKGDIGTEVCARVFVWICVYEYSEGRIEGYRTVSPLL